MAVTNQALVGGYQLLNYRIDRQISRGGFSIVYRAFDDTGAAGQTLTSARPKLAPMYTPGFAAPEQYREPDRLGPWTDVYGVGASMFACLAAFALQAADARVQEDHLVSAKKIWAGQYSENVLEVIDWCLRLDPPERPPSVFAFQKGVRAIPPRQRKLTFRDTLKKKPF